MLKNFLRFAGAIFVVLIVLFLIAKSVGDANYYADYDATLPADAMIKEESEVKEAKEVFGVQRERTSVRWPGTIWPRRSFSTITPATPFQPGASGSAVSAKSAAARPLTMTLVSGAG